jgi:hypothetical protein
MTGDQFSFRNGSQNTNSYVGERLPKRLKEWFECCRSDDRASGDGRPWNFVDGDMSRSIAASSPAFHTCSNHDVMISRFEFLMVPAFSSDGGLATTCFSGAERLVERRARRCMQTDAIAGIPTKLIRVRSN